MTGVAHLIEWTKAHRWWVALVLVIVAGYSIGKDMALMENAREAPARAGGA